MRAEFRHVTRKALPVDFLSKQVYVSVSVDFSTCSFMYVKGGRCDFSSRFVMSFQHQKLHWIGLLVWGYR